MKAKQRKDSPQGLIDKEKQKEFRHLIIQWHGALELSTLVRDREGFTRVWNSYEYAEDWGKINLSGKWLVITM